MFNDWINADIKIKKEEVRKIVKKLMDCLDKEYRRYALLTPVVMIGEVVMEVALPFIMARIIDVGIQNKDITYITKMGILMIVMALLSLTFGALAARFSAIAGTGFSNGVRKKLFYKIQEFSFSNVDKFSTPSLVTRLTTDVTNLQNAFMMVIRIMVRAPMMLVCAIFMSIYINARLSLIFFVAVPILGVAFYFISKGAFPRFKSMLKKYDKMNARVQENLVAIRVVKAFVREDYEIKKFNFSADEVRKAQLRAEKIIIFNMPIMQLVMYGCMIAVSWFGGNLIISQNMQTGQLMSFISYVTQILMSLMMISMIFVMLVLTRASVSRIIEIFDEEVDIKNNIKNPKKEVKNGSISFENVTFKYTKESENVALSNINLDIKSGETIGIIGETGSSKSTLVQLISRLYDVNEGKILVGGVDVRDYDTECLRNSVATVLQKNVLFSGTIIDNLRWGNENATEEEVINACKDADAHNFIMGFPNKYKTDLGQGGVNLSGGQKQRLCIARALLKKPKIIIMDDSTSAVDTNTDSNIRKALRKNLKGTTTIIIAQRISSISECDRIVMMSDGKIDQIGTHKELLKNNMIYKEIYDSQQKGAQEDA
ncbi:ABC transporter ATP-binding protein [Clostridium sp. BJN0001]|uniref:ABC transporter ATP-binding protein n=1 Tax=Clostridium sp. BJN0001 TaxID=2930219 RepID=UPI001FD537DC|nr:ABC transporter ATP-binding protein [Clostridium sp. BJN0001]